MRRGAAWSTHLGVSTMADDHPLQAKPPAVDHPNVVMMAGGTAAVGAAPAAVSQQPSQQTQPPPPPTAPSSCNNTNNNNNTPTMSWEPIRKRLLGSDLADALEAAHGIRQTMGRLVQQPTEFALLLSALLPAFSSLLTTNSSTNSSGSTPAAATSSASSSHTSTTTTTTTQQQQQQQLRHAILQILTKFPCNEFLRPHASHLIVVNLDILHRDTEENALLASHLIFDLYKTYRNLPPDHVQMFLDFVFSMYTTLPTSVQRNFSNCATMVTATTTTASSSSTTTAPAVAAAPVKVQGGGGAVPTTTTNSTPAAPSVVAPVATTATVAATATSTAVKPPPPTTTSAAPAPLPSSTPSAATPLPSSAASAAPTTAATTTTAPAAANTGKNVAVTAVASSSATAAATNNNSTTTSKSQLLPSKLSFRVLTECPLTVMLMFQLYPNFLQPNVTRIIKVMLDALGLRAPPLASILQLHNSSSNTNTNSADNNNNNNSAKHVKRAYYTRLRELVAAQAKTLSFITMLLKSFTSQLAPYQDRLAQNVVDMFRNCPHESIGTRKELIAATRHLFNSELRPAFVRHVDVLLDERLFLGHQQQHRHCYYYSSRNSSSSGHVVHAQQQLYFLRTMGYQTLSELVQHVRNALTMPQATRIVGTFARVLHEYRLPVASQYTAVRTLLSLGEVIYRNKDSTTTNSSSNTNSTTTTAATNATPGSSSGAAAAAAGNTTSSSSGNSSNSNHPQMGRDLLVRIITSMSSKLEAIVAGVELQDKERLAQAKSNDKSNNNSNATTQNDSDAVFKDAESIRDAQTLVRLILVGSKNIIHYLADYRNQREKVSREMAMPPPGSNEEVASAYHKLTQTEVQLLNRYLRAAIPGLALLRRQQQQQPLPGQQQPTKSSTSSSNINACTTPNNNNGNAKASSSSSRDKVSDQYRDALTYFAATFASLDGYNLRRTVGRNIDLLVDAIVEDPMVMIVPRHLLAINATTSYEFCAILVPYLMKRLGSLRCGSGGGNNVTSAPSQQQHAGIHFMDAVEGDKDDCREALLAQCTDPDTLDRKKCKDTSQALLQLFERVLKSLNTYPDNESLVRRHLRPIVAQCLSTCLENTDNWPDDYCMLLRYVFRSISAGKFEESYRELLPLIPTVLNGLYRIICVSEDTLLRHTAIELCLTIPARLSSLLPHMNLLLRVIVPALDSGSGDLVNLGLRTLEFWVDNLNPLFLYPEMSKETPAFAYLMQSLSCHLRPAPYPYGLLTLRLLGKLGGRNREFLRDPLVLQDRPKNLQVSQLQIDCKWRAGGKDATSLPLPVEKCFEILKLLAVAGSQKQDSNDEDDESPQDGEDSAKEVITWDQYEQLWTKNLECVDFEAYSVDVRDKTRKSQAAAALTVIRTSLLMLSKTISRSEEAKQSRISNEVESDVTSTGHQVVLAILYACCIESVSNDAKELITEALVSLPISTLCDSFTEFVGDSIPGSFEVMVDLYEYLSKSTLENFETKEFWLVSVKSLCSMCCSATWERQAGAQRALCYLAEKLGQKWAFEHEVALINAAMISLKSVPRELSGACANAVVFFVRICVLLYGKPNGLKADGSEVIWDVLSGYEIKLSEKTSTTSSPHAEKSQPSEDASSEAATKCEEKQDSAQAGEKPASDSDEPGGDIEESCHPSENVMVLVIRSLVSTQHLARFASRFLISHYTDSMDVSTFRSKHLDLVKRVLFSRSMKLLPLPHQVGAAEGLTLIVTKFPDLLPLSDQYLLAFLSELLKMSSVADGEMSDSSLSDYVVDKNGFCGSSDDRHQSITDPSHSSGIFFRRECILDLSCGFRVHLPAEMPTGVQLRISSIKLLHSVIRNQSDAFFDADDKTPIGNIRPHVISLLFRSLVSRPEKAVFASHVALRDVLSLSVSKGKSAEESSKAPSRLPKELLQTCIRPVLLNLRDYQRLSVPLLRGLSKLLSLLSSWFNKTLGEKLLDHLQKWMDPGRILSLKLWHPGEEPAVAAAIVEIFALLPHASNFVEPLVKTCMKLEASLPALKIRLVQSPYRKPLARYLSNHPSSTVNFFFKRLPTPMYSELFQWLVRCEESSELRKYLAGKPCSMMILNHCFEKPLGIIRAEKDSSATPQSSREVLAQHGIGTSLQQSDIGPSAKMSTGALELQLQGFILVNTLMTSDPEYIKNQSDIVRAFRWLWRSKGRALRFKHESGVPPRFHSESKMLASFLVNYAKSYPSEGLDILFELVSAFIQPATVDFSFLVVALNDLVSNILSLELKQRVLDRFFELVSRDKSEEMKVLSIQFLIYPMLDHSSDGVLLTSQTVTRFVKDVLYQKGAMIVCTDRLKVELLRLTDLVVERAHPTIAPFKAEIFQYGLNLLKNDDLSCKGWAYVVVARMISVFGAEESLILQVYTSLLRTHQQEIRDMVRKALDLLVPSLSTQLGESKADEAIKQAATVMVEDGNSSPQLAHICAAVVANPTVFFPHRRVFAKHITKSLSRLSLPATPTLESRMLAVDNIELLLEWESKHLDVSPLFSLEQLEVMANFLVRLKILMAEPHDSRGFRIEISPPQLDRRIMKLVEDLIQRPGVEIRKQPFEKVSGREKQAAVALLSCIDLFDCFSKVGKTEFFASNMTLTSEIVLASFVEASNDVPLRQRVRSFVLDSKDVPPIVSPSLVALERIINSATREQRKQPHSRSSESRSSMARSPRGKDKGKANNDVSAEYTYYAIHLALELGQYHDRYLRRIASSTLDFADVVAKNHLLDAAAKQRQGTAAGPPNTSPGLLHHTPTRGIVEEASLRDRIDASRLAQMRPKVGKDAEASDIWIRCLIVTLNAFETSELAFGFTHDRKCLLQILSSILDSSDNVQLLMVATRIIGKWLLSVPKGGPLTQKERNSFLWKIASFDFNGLSDDLSAQPLADLVSYFVETVKTADDESVVIGENIVIGRSLVACLLHAHCDVRNRLMSSYLETKAPGASNKKNFSGGHELVETFWRLLHSDVEGLASRSWIALFVDGFLMSLSAEHERCIDALRSLAHGDVMLCQQLFEWMLPVVWNQIPTDGTRLRITNAMEAFLARPFHSQFQKSSNFAAPRERRCSNAIRAFLSGIALISPSPVLDPHLVVSLAENYTCWYEVISLLEKQYVALKSIPQSHSILDAIRHCYRQLGEEDLSFRLAEESCKSPKTLQALSFDIYGLVNEAVTGYEELVNEVEAPDSKSVASDFEMDLWEERWVGIQRELCQLNVVSEFANSAGSLRLRLECAWKSQDWHTVRSLCSSTSLLAAIESGDPIVKISETLLAVADGKLSDVENLHAQTAQLCLHKWQLLPRLSNGSPSHASLLHYFHRLVEIRESGQIMLETSNHSKVKTLPDLKNLLNAWRHRLPNTCEPMTMWDDVFSWRAHMFSAITSNFSWSEPNALAALHDRPWTTIRMAKTARKHGMRDVSMLLLNQAVDEGAMNVSDAFLKVREQILAYFNKSSDLERHGGLNLVNATNLGFFDQPQKSELFRLKASFLASLGSRSKANQAFCHSLQICPTHARGWESWGGLCSALGDVAAKQVEEAKIEAAKDPTKKDAIAAASKKVAQYLAQAMGCYLEAIQIDANEWNRVHLPKCIWMLTKDGGSPGILCQTFENRGAPLPPWVWLPWLPQLFTSLYREEGRAVRTIFARILKAYPQAVYYPLRAFFLERRDVERAKNSSSSSQLSGSAGFAEEMVSQLRRSHTSLWSSLESILEELLVKFRPAHEEEFLATTIALLERAEAQATSIRINEGDGKKEEDAVTTSVWKTLGRIAVKFFRHSDSGSLRKDDRTIKTTDFKKMYRESFEKEFHVSASEAVDSDKSSPISLKDILTGLRKWKEKIEEYVMATPRSVPLIEASRSLAMHCVGDSPDLWPGSCDPRYASPIGSERDQGFGAEQSSPQSTTSSVLAAKKAAIAAAKSTAAAATREGVGGDYGGGSSFIEIPGQYMPNTTCWADVRPSPELHPKLLRFAPTVKVLKRNDQLVRRITMIASNGRAYSFILQQSLPYLTRTDERTAQTFYVLDKVLRKSVRTARVHMSIQPNTVIPVAQRLRLVNEPVSQRSLEQIIDSQLSATSKDSSSLTHEFQEGIKEALSDDEFSKLEKQEKQTEEKARRLGVFQTISRNSPVAKNVLSHHMLRVLESPEPFFQFRRIFSMQWAANCLLQHVFHVVERTPSRVVLMETDGRVLAPEFRIRYTSQGQLEVQPQAVPFRLTPSLVHLIGFLLVDGRFVTSMARIATAVSDPKQASDLESIWRLLLRDDLTSYFTKSMAKPDTKTQEMERQLADRVSKNVVTIQKRFLDLAVQTKTDTNGDAPVDHRIRALVEQAQDPKMLAMMGGNFQGWI